MQDRLRSMVNFTSIFAANCVERSVIQDSLKCSVYAWSILQVRLLDITILRHAPQFIQAHRNIMEVVSRRVASVETPAFIPAIIAGATFPFDAIRVRLVIVIFTFDACIGSLKLMHHQLRRFEKGAYFGSLTSVERRQMKFSFLWTAAGTRDFSE